MTRFAHIKVRKEPVYRREAIEKGLKKLGYTIWPTLHPDSREDLLVLWNRKRGADEAAADRWEAAGGTVLVLENGYLQKVDKTMYAISVHGHNGSGWFPVGDEDRFSRLGFEVKPWRPTMGGHWLVCGQRGIGSSLMASPPQWAEKTAAKLKKWGLPVRLRLHPGNFAPKVPLLDDLKGAHTCAIWSSGSGVRAIVEGIPVQHSAPHWICAGAGTSGAPEDHRQQALHRMSHGQWSVDEIASGEPFARILNQLEHATWP
jgi:hypothetical protein